MLEVLQALHNTSRVHSGSLLVFLDFHVIECGFSRVKDWLIYGVFFRPLLDNVADDLEESAVKRRVSFDIPLPCVDCGCIRLFFAEILPERLMGLDVLFIFEPIRPPSEIHWQRRNSADRRVLAIFDNPLVVA